MVTPGAGFRGGTFFGPTIGEDQKKRSSPKISGFSVQMRIGTKQSEKEGIHLKLVELWFLIIIWYYSKMVTPGWAVPLATPLAQPTDYLI